MKIDLHIHTSTGSDGNLSVEKVFTEARKRNIDFDLPPKNCTSYNVPFSHIDKPTTKQLDSTSNTKDKTLGI